MHKIYIEEGSYNIIYHISQILYSSLLSLTITIIIRYLALSEQKIISFKHENIKTLLKEKFVKLSYKLRVHFSLFFILSFLFSLAFGYYLICFCCIYVNTQIHLIKDSVMSFGLSLLYPFVIYLLPSVLRIYALHSSKKNKYCWYKLSKILQRF